MQLGMVGLGRMGANIVRRLCATAIPASSTTSARRRSRRSPPRERPGAASLDDFVAELDVPRRRVDHGPGRARSPSRRSTSSPRRLERGRHDHRRRQLLLPRRHPPRGRARRAGHPLRRLRHERRRLRARARVLPHGRRARRRVRRARADLRLARARRRRRRSGRPGATGEPAAGGARLPPLRPGRAPATS